MMREKKKKRNKVVAFLLAAVLSVTSLPLGGMTAQAASEPPEGCTLLARYPLQRDVMDISGNGRDAEVHGSVLYDDGLTLPGGKKTSAADASYVALPGDMFVGKEELTISVWLKNKTAKGNYAALFFGTAPQNNNMPLNYWLFNPINPDEKFKSVFTDSDNSGAPYNTEIGVTAGSMAAYKDTWAHYTTVIKESTMTGYVNGKKLGSTGKSKTVASFGSALQAYIGRSNYVEDTTYGGSFQDLKIYEGAMTPKQVQDLYLDAEQVNENVQSMILREIKGKLTLEEQIQNGMLLEEKALTLPSQFMGASVTWASSNEAIIGRDGAVKLPAQQTTVVLTASLQCGNVSDTKEISVTVLPAGGALSYVADSLQIPYVLGAAYQLPVTVGDVSIQWSGSDKVKADGSIVADFDGKQEFNVTAQLSDGTKTQSKSFRGYLLGRDAGYVQPYTRTPSGDCVDKLARSMFLAYSDNGTDGFTALHDDYGVLFMRAESREDESLLPKSLKDPYLFYTKEGSYGVAAVRTEVDGRTDATKASAVMFYTSEDLLDYDEVGFVDLHTDSSVCEPVCEYDSSMDFYRITWNDGNGTYYQNTLKTLQSEASEPIPASAVSIKAADTGLSGTKQGNLFAMEHEKALRLKNKLSKIVNTGMQVPMTIKAASAEDVQGVRATALYNDGSTASKKVEWDLSGVDFEKQGVYAVNGTVTQPTFDNSKHLFEARPDPEMVKYNGTFYFISTDERGQGKIYIRKSDTLEGIKNSSETLLLDGSSFPDLFKTCLWAPELHVIEGNLYIFFAGSLTNWSGVQSHVMRLKEGGDPMKTADWETPIRVKDKDGNNLYDTDTQGITLDMTYFEDGETSYVAWAQRQLHPVDTGSWLYIATVDREKPWQLTSDRTAFCKPDYGWDNNNTFVVEAPFVLQKDGTIHLTFSGGATDHTYCIGEMTAAAGSDLLDVTSWRKGNYPILTSWSVENQYGPGHNAYIMDDDGTVYNIYHAKWGRSAIRSASIRRVHFDVDGDPVLDLVEERDLLDEFKQVSMQVQVVDSSYQPNEELQSLYHSCAESAKQGQGLTSDGDWKEFQNSLAAAQKLLGQENPARGEVLTAIDRLEQTAQKLRYASQLVITQKPAKTQYQIGESFDAAGLKVEVVDNKGDKHEVDIKDCSITGFDSRMPGEKQITVAYQSLSASFRVTVKAGQEAPAEPTAPAAAVIQKKTAAYNSVTLQWKKVADADGYVVYRAASKKGSYKKVKTIAKADTLTYKDGKLAFNKTYYYKVRTYKNVDGKTLESKDSNVLGIKTQLAAPSVSLSKKSKTKLTVKWKKVAGASGYQVQYSLKKKSGYRSVTVKKAKATSYTKSGLKKGKTYYVKVRAYRTVKGKKIPGTFCKVKSIKMK